MPLIDQLDTNCVHAVLRGGPLDGRCEVLPPRTIRMQWSVKKADFVVRDMNSDNALQEHHRLVDYRILLRDGKFVQNGDGSYPFCFNGYL